MNFNLNSRPRFFTGQLIDYRDFNSLSARPDELMGALLARLYPGGGVLGTTIGDRDSLTVRVYEGMLVELGPGMAILPNGQALIQKEARLLDLAPFALDGQAKTVVVYARNVIRGDEHYVDPDDNTITGYKTERFEPECYFSQKLEPADDSIELFRVVLPGAVGQLRLLSQSEEWKSDGELSAQLKESPEAGLVDLRHRRILSPIIANPYGVTKMIDVRKSLAAIRNGVERLAKTYFVPDPFHTDTYLSLLEAEILSQPFQPMKISFLVADLAAKLCFYFEHLLNKTEASRSDFNRNLALEAIQILEPARKAVVRAESIHLDKILELDAKLREMVDFSEANFSLSNTIREALSELRSRHFNYQSKISIAGRVFEKVDAVEVGQEKKWSTHPDEKHLRKISAQFRDGNELALNGAFIRSGRFFIQFEARHANRPLLLLFNQYIRRAGSKIHYELNGKALESDTIEDLSFENCWINKGLVVSPELLVAGENQLSIHVERTDLDFGFFGLAVYQPTLSEDQS